MKRLVAWTGLTISHFLTIFSLKFLIERFIIKQDVSAASENLRNNIPQFQKPLSEKHSKVLPKELDF